MRAFKLIEFFEDGRLELYNLDEDPGETVNLAESHPEQMLQMKKALKQWQHSVEAKIPQPNPDIDSGT